MLSPLSTEKLRQQHLHFYFYKTSSPCADMSPDYYCFDQFLHEAGSPPDCLLRQFPGDNDNDIDEDDIAASVAVDGGEQDWDLQPDHQGAALFEAASVNATPPLLLLDPAAPLADLNGSQLP